MHRRSLAPGYAPSSPPAFTRSSLYRLRVTPRRVSPASRRSRIHVSGLRPVEYFLRVTSRRVFAPGYVPSSTSRVEAVESLPPSLPIKRVHSSATACRYAHSRFMHRRIYFSGLRPVERSRIYAVEACFVSGLRPVELSRVEAVEIVFSGLSPLPPSRLRAVKPSRVEAVEVIFSSRACADSAYAPFRNFILLHSAPLCPLPHAPSSPPASTRSSIRLYGLRPHRRVLFTGSIEHLPRRGGRTCFLLVTSRHLPPVYAPPRSFLRATPRRAFTGLHPVEHLPRRGGRAALVYAPSSFFLRVTRFRPVEPSSIEVVKLCRRVSSSGFHPVDPSRVEAVEYLLFTGLCPVERLQFTRRRTVEPRRGGRVPLFLPGYVPLSASGSRTVELTVPGYPV
ncbi:hypothetical protein MKEN_00836100 [Mycena kentingensis (nom. inval.)]|nr:hypothetical protein MKEN_00836100 [Mycena kentingensis (nom. inval.)]